MSVQRKLNALLFELQSARSPLAQAKVLARSWRTLRELSPTDRRLLARHAGFDGAEQLLEGLAGKEKRFAPAALLEVLNRARAADGEAVGEMLDALRDPTRRKEALSRGAEIAVDLLSEEENGSEEEEPPQEISEALGQLHSVERDVLETPEEALAALSALEGKTADPGPVEAPAPPVSAEKEKDKPAASPSPKGETPDEPRPEVVRPAPRPATAPMAEWNHLSGVAIRHQPDSADEGTGSRIPADRKQPAFDALAVLEALGAEASVFSRLRVLNREIDGIRGSKTATLRSLLETFPSGWARRRALAALISAGIPESDTEALELIAGLESEIDRGWCLGALARRGAFKGGLLQRALDLVDSPAVRRRLQILSERG
jgi:outer membrane biosynthesis protein TonB